MSIPDPLVDDWPPACIIADRMSLKEPLVFELAPGTGAATELEIGVVH
jgi:hypothetical protein